MHILHVFPSFQIGGSQRRFASLANHFGARYRHTVIALDGCRTARSLLDHDGLFAFYPAPAKSSLPTTLVRAAKTIRRLKPDLLVTYNWGAMEWAAANVFCGVRHVHIEDGFGPEEAQDQLMRRVLFRRLVLNVKSAVVLPSQNLVNLAKDVWRIAPARISFVPNGIACARFRGPGDDTLDFRGSGPVIGTVATLRKEKALDRLIAAFKELRHIQEARLVIVGDGPERPALEACVASAGLTDCVTFTGNLSDPERVVGRFDIFAISSDTEQMPLSVLEAMAAGKPVASTDVGDIRFMVAEQNAPFVVAKEVSALTVAMGLLLKDQSLCRIVGAANQERATREFDESAMFARYEAIFSGQA